LQTIQSFLVSVCYLRNVRRKELWVKTTKKYKAELLRRKF
jgi:hypothetical protein